MNRDDTCPHCGGEGLEEIRQAHGSRLLKCLSCGAVSRAPLREAPKILAVKTIVSREGDSKVCTTELPEDEIVALGDQLAAECGEEVIGVEIAGIETGERRVGKAKAGDVSTLWTRAIEEVTVHISVHDGRKTIPLLLKSPGEETFEVGDEKKIGKTRFRITQIKLRDGALLRKEGWRTVAKKIKRIYGSAI
jgi:uncharacterized Zn finger protein